MLQVGDKVKVIQILPLTGNNIAPPLLIDEERVVKQIILDSKGNGHVDLGLESKYNYITSYETKEELPNGHLIHWVHPSRLQKI